MRPEVVDGETRGGRGGGEERLRLCIAGPGRLGVPLRTQAGDVDSPQSCRLGGREGGIAGLVPEASLPGVWKAISSPCPHVVTPLCVSGSSSLLVRTPVLWGQDPP